MTRHRIPNGEPSPIALVILAAGASTRLGECKALADFGGRSGLERLLRAGASLSAESAVVVPPIVVTGAHHAQIAARGPWNAELLHNPDWELGRTGGLAQAVSHRPGLDICVASVDTPLVGREVFEGLASCWRSAGSPAFGWLAARCGERHGHPMFLGHELVEKISELGPGESLRELRVSAQPLFAWATTDIAVLDDLDTPADLARLRGRILPD